MDSRKEWGAFVQQGLSLSRVIQIVSLYESLFSQDIPSPKNSSPLGIDFNDKLRLASSWFGMCGISSQVSPQPLNASSSGGMHVLKADTFDLHSYQTLTGTTFMLVTSPNYRNAARVLKDTVYTLYCDYVLKNPFYEADQVIKSSLFDQKLVESLSTGLSTDT